MSDPLASGDHHEARAAADADAARSPATGQQLLALARALATVVHGSQSRKGKGEPYVRHVERVAERVDGWRAKTIAYLHDVIEDTNVGPVILSRIGFPSDIIIDVSALSRREGEAYADFITRTLSMGSDDALRVKLADLQDNLTDPWVVETKLTSRYIPAARRVTEELARREVLAAVRNALHEGATGETSVQGDGGKMSEQQMRQIANAALAAVRGDATEETT